MRFIRYGSRVGMVIAVLAVIAGFFGATRTTAANPAAKTVKAAVLQPPGEYVGQETCLTCHESQGYKGTAHALTSNDRTPASTHGCESCHGPGKAHVDGGGDKTKIVNPKNLTAQQSSERCATCHDRAKHALWAGSQHDQRNVGCVTCHSVHTPKGPKQLKASTEAEVCATCHKNVVNKLFRFNHMPVREGKIQCSSCHNPHGSVNQRLLSVRNQALCLKCHFQQQTAPGQIFIADVNHANFLPQGACWSAGCHEAVHGSQVSPALRY